MAVDLTDQLLVVAGGNPGASWAGAGVGGGGLSAPPNNAAKQQLQILVVVEVAVVSKQPWLVKVLLVSLLFVIKLDQLSAAKATGGATLVSMIPKLFTFTTSGAFAVTSWINISVML